MKICRAVIIENVAKITFHDDVIKWKHFPRNWPFVTGIYLSLVDFPHKGQWLWWFFLSTPEQMVEQTTETPGIWDAMELIMTSLKCFVSLCTVSSVQPYRHRMPQRSRRKITSELISNQVHDIVLNKQCVHTWHKIHSRHQKHNINMMTSWHRSQQPRPFF